MGLNCSIVLMLALACVGCVSARYSTSPSSRIANDCGEFVAESDTAGVAVSEAIKNYGNACRDIQMAGADAAYTKSLADTALWYQKEAMRAADFAEAPELVAEDLAGILGPQHPPVGIRPTTCIKPATRAQCRVLAQRLIATFTTVVPTTLAYADAANVLTITIGPSDHPNAPLAVTGAVINTSDDANSGAILATATRLSTP